MSFKTAIINLISLCQTAIIEQKIGPDEIRHKLLPEHSQTILNSATDFLHWIQDDPEYRFYYYEAQESGICAKPKETAASILEAIVLDALGEVEG